MIQNTHISTNTSPLIWSRLAGTKQWKKTFSKTCIWAKSLMYPRDEDTRGPWHWSNSENQQGINSIDTSTWKTKTHVQLLLRLTATAPVTVNTLTTRCIMIRMKKETFNTIFVFHHSGTKDVFKSRMWGWREINFKNDRTNLFRGSD